MKVMTEAIDPEVLFSVGLQQLRDGRIVRRDPTPSEIQERRKRAAKEEGRRLFSSDIDANGVAPAKYAFYGVPESEGVYFAIDGNLLKIGYSDNVLSRLRTHRGSNLRLRPIAIVRGTKKDEGRIHRHFGDFRIEGTMEWFLYDDVFIRTSLFVTMNYPVVWRSRFDFG